jgi:hypothetical protein
VKGIGLQKLLQNSTKALLEVIEAMLAYNPGDRLEFF